jgi:hypothetical protein
VRVSDAEVVQVDAGARDQRDFLAGRVQLLAHQCREAQQPVLLASIVHLWPVAELRRRSLAADR